MQKRKSNCLAVDGVRKGMGRLRGFFSGSAPEKSCKSEGPLKKCGFKLVEIVERWASFTLWYFALYVCMVGLAALWASSRGSAPEIAELVKVSIGIEVQREIGTIYMMYQIANIFWKFIKDVWKFEKSQSHELGGAKELGTYILLFAWYAWLFLCQPFSLAGLAGLTVAFWLVRRLCRLFMQLWSKQENHLTPCGHAQKAAWEEKERDGH